LTNASKNAATTWPIIYKVSRPTWEILNTFLEVFL
jgi:hypothetical protein